MHWQLGDEAALAAAWRTAQPFPHLVIDDFAGDVEALLALVDEEHVDRYEADLFVFEASAPEPRSDELRAVRASFTEALVAPLARITGKALARADMRAFAYRPGHYLLPHTDHQEGLGRAIAYAFYLPSPEPPVGGELELFACGLADREIVSVATARTIAPQPNRIVLFEVGDASLHQVREVVAGLRISLAGWFYP